MPAPDAVATPPSLPVPTLGLIGAQAPNYTAPWTGTLPLLSPSQYSADTPMSVSAANYASWKFRPLSINPDERGNWYRIDAKLTRKLGGAPYPNYLYIWYRQISNPAVFGLLGTVNSASGSGTVDIQMTAGFELVLTVRPFPVTDEAYMAVVRVSSPSQSMVVQDQDHWVVARADGSLAIDDEEFPDAWLVGEDYVTSPLGTRVGDHSFVPTAFGERPGTSDAAALRNWVMAQYSHGTAARWNLGWDADPYVSPPPDNQDNPILSPHEHTSSPGDSHHQVGWDFSYDNTTDLVTGIVGIHSSASLYSVGWNLNLSYSELWDFGTRARPVDLHGDQQVTDIYQAWFEADWPLNDVEMNTPLCEILNLRFRPDPLTGDDVQPLVEQGSDTITIYWGLSPYIAEAGSASDVGWGLYYETQEDGTAVPVFKDQMQAAKKFWEFRSGKYQPSDLNPPPRRDQYGFYYAEDFNFDTATLWEDDHRPGSSDYDVAVMGGFQFWALSEQQYKATSTWLVPDGEKELPPDVGGFFPEDADDESEGRMRPDVHMAFRFFVRPGTYTVWLKPRLEPVPTELYVAAGHIDRTRRRFIHRASRTH